MNYPVLPLTAVKGGSQRGTQQQSRHRIPLVEMQMDALSSLEDDIFLLQAHAVRDEIMSVNEEVVRLDAEVQALEDDRMELGARIILHLPSRNVELPRPGDF
jgi:hypothetical protein